VILQKEANRMSQSFLPPEIRQMPVPDRVALVERIWDSIAEDQSSFELTDSQKAELDRRLTAHRASPEIGRSWEEVKKGILNS